jgi:hypothetical protein
MRVHPPTIHIAIDKKQPENVEYFSIIVTNDAICTRELKSRFATCKTT